MTMDADTGEGFDAVLVSQEEYFDPDAQDPSVPGVMGLVYKKSTYWQGNVEFETFDLIGPKYGPEWPQGSLKAGGLGLDAEVWGLSNKKPPLPGDPVFNNGLGVGNDPNAPQPGRDNSLATTGDSRFLRIAVPCYEADGITLAIADEPRNDLDITLFGAYGGEIKFPVLPAEVGASFTHEYWTPKVVGLGEVVLPGGDAMETISWDSFFPATYDSNYVTISPLEMETPKSITERIIWTMRFKTPCKLVVGGEGMWNDQVVITNFSYKHIAGEPKDIYYTIGFKRYRTPVVTTAINPDPNKVWVKDPRGTPTPLVQASQAPTDGDTTAQDPNPEAVDIVPEAPTTRTFDEGPATAEREALITIESATVQHSTRYWKPENATPVTGPARPIGGELELAPARPKGESNAVDTETTQDIAERLSGEGPNTLDSILALNPWILDNGYSPYTTHLPWNSGVRYYKLTPVMNAKPIVIVHPNVGAPQEGVDGTVYFPRGTRVEIPGTRVVQGVGHTIIRGDGNIPSPGVPGAPPLKVP